MVGGETMAKTSKIPETPVAPMTHCPPKIRVPGPLKKAFPVKSCFLAKIAPRAEKKNTVKKFNILPSVPVGVAPDLLVHGHTANRITKPNHKTFSTRSCFICRTWDNSSLIDCKEFDSNANTNGENFFRISYKR